MFWLRRSKCYESFESESSGGGARFQSFSCKSVHIPGRATAAARAVLPIPAIACSFFVCVQTMVWCIDHGVAKSVPHQGVAYVEVALFV